MKKIVFLALFIIVSLFIGSPYYTAYQLKKAYKAHDGNTLVSYINFEQLQPNLKLQLHQKFANTLSQYPMIKKIGGAPLTKTANQFIDNAVDKAITADNISRLINTQGQDNEYTKELAAAWAIASNKVNLQNLIQDMIAMRGDVDSVVKNQMQYVTQQQAHEITKNAETGEDSEKPQLDYCGINCVNISGNLKGYPVTIEMQRQGFMEWKIINVVLP